jgi:hypothetical protein
MSASASSQDCERRVSFFQAGPARARPCEGRDTQRDEPQAAKLWTGDGGIAVAQNLTSENEVDAMMARAEAAGTRILRPAAKTFWVGLTDTFADPDGRVWEVAINPFWKLECNRVRLPD